MPITEEQMPYEGMMQAAITHSCGECGSGLSVAYGGFYGIPGYILRCGDNINHETITRHNKATDDKNKNIREATMTQSKDLMVMTEAKMMERVNMAKFPQDLNPAEKKLLAVVALTYGLDPLMKELGIYQGFPHVSIDGRYRKAQETGELDGVESRPSTKQEREDWEIPDGDYFYHANIWRKGASHPFVGWGRVHKSETTPGSTRPNDTTSTYKPIQKNPQRMAEKRAEAMGLRKAFHIPLPSMEDIGAPDYDVESTAEEIEQ